LRLVHQLLDLRRLLVDALAGKRPHGRHGHIAERNTSGSQVVVLLVDDQAIVAAAVKQIFAGEPGVELHYGNDAPRAIDRATPALVLLDVDRFKKHNEPGCGHLPAQPRGEAPSLVGTADANLHEAKRSGRNRLVCSSAA
jgi:PleD family two-component response regulator